MSQSGSLQNNLRDFSVLTTLLERAAEEKAIMGAVMMVAIGGDLAFSHAVGLADNASGEAMSAATSFRLASLSKLFTSITALRLIEQNQISLDTTVSDVLPSFDPKLENGDCPTITVRHLLTHTAGLTYPFQQSKSGPYHKLAVTSGLDGKGVTEEEFLQKLAAAPLIYAPGTRWAYSTATDVLGALITKITGRALFENIRQFVLDPLNLNSIAFHLPDSTKIATPYAETSNGLQEVTDGFRLPFGSSTIHFEPSRIYDSRSFQSGGAGLVGKAEEVLRVLEVVRCGGAPILLEQSVRDLTQNATAEFKINAAPPGWGFGLGVATLLEPTQSNAPQQAGTWGWGGVYGHTYFVDPASEISVVLLTNTAPTGMLGSAFSEQVTRALYQSL